MDALRTYLAYVTYLVRLQSVATVAGIVTLVTFFSSAVAFRAVLGTPNLVRSLTIAVLVTLAGATFNLLWSCVELRWFFKEYFHRLDSLPGRQEVLDLPWDHVALKDIRPSAREEEHGFQKLSTQQGEPVIASDALDSSLRSVARELRVSAEGRRRLLRYIRENRSALLPLLAARVREARAQNKRLFNERKLCLSDDLLPDQAVAFCHEGSYFDSQLTNDGCTTVLRDASSGEIVFDGSRYFPADRDPSGPARLRGLGLSRMSNHIGVSTLGFTSDRHLVIWRQSPKAQQSEELLAPTGSGSCDWKDRSASSAEGQRAPGGGLSGCLARAMERELREESARSGIRLPAAAIHGTMVLGFFRWVRRGGKPEFVGITRLALARAELEPDHIEVQHPLTVLSDYSAPTLAALKEACATIRKSGQMSIPLEMSLRALERFLDDDSDALRTFLGLEA